MSTSKLKAAFEQSEEALPLASPGPINPYPVQTRTLPPSPKHPHASAVQIVKEQELVAGAGFEPTTFGL